MTPAQKAIRLRLRDDFVFYARHALKIRTKDGEIVPFIPNEAQRRLLAVISAQYAAEGKVRIIILKARQMGLSTAVGGRLFSRVSQRRAKKAIVVAHVAESTRFLFDMTQRFYDLVPEFLKPQTKYSSRKELQFGVLDSGYSVATAGGDGVGRGGTFTHAHISELAFWPKGSAAAQFNGLMKAVPNADDTEIYIESTANGVSGLFYDTWQAAVRGENGFIPLFLPWYIQEEYRAPVPANFKRLPHEQEMADAYGLDDAQLCFRRSEVALNGPELFQQEYPSTAEEAFLTTGRPVFHPQQVARMVAEAREEFAPGTQGNHWEPLARMALEGASWEHHPRGELFCYRPHDPQETYYLGADVGAGVQRDWSVVQVQDSRKRQVAMWRGQIDPDYFATVIYQLAKFYNMGEVIVERNNHGILTNRVLAVDHAYQNVYRETSYDKITDTTTDHIGFFTSEKSKAVIIDKLRADVREGTAEVVDPVSLAEMRSFVVTETGKMEADKGSHDDTVMALALVNHINAGAFTPYVNLDTYYARLE